MTRLTQEQVASEPWKYNSTHWRLAHGIHIPHIAEISPMQYAHLSKRGKRAYDAKRDQEWSASIAGEQAWRAAVLDAYDAGRFDPRADDVTRDAATIIFLATAERAKQHAKDDEQTRRAIARKLAVGDQVWSLMYRATGTVTKINPKSVRVQFVTTYKTFETNMNPAVLQWPDGR